MLNQLKFIIVLLFVSFFVSCVSTNGYMKFYSPTHIDQHYTSTNKVKVCRVNEQNIKQYADQLFEKGYFFIGSSTFT